jgi:hypothetical protein
MGRRIDSPILRRLTRLAASCSIQSRLFRFPKLRTGGVVHYVIQSRDVTACSDSEHLTAKGAKAILRESLKL